ncbi:plasmid protein [Escherichia coli]|nr:plasmid protein [Escherichia coli]
MALAGSEMKRLYAVGSENGGDGDAFVREELEAMDVCVAGAGRGDDVMNISTETREILRNYRAVINARRREMGQKPLTTAQIVDEICDFVANQQAVFLGGHYILQGSRNR